MYSSGGSLVYGSEGSMAYGFGSSLVYGSGGSSHTASCILLLRPYFLHAASPILLLRPYFSDPAFPTLLFRSCFSDSAFLMLLFRLCFSYAASPTLLLHTTSCTVVHQAAPKAVYHVKYYSIFFFLQVNSGCRSIKFVTFLLLYTLLIEPM